MIGAKPPHLLTAADREKNYRREDLFIDPGLPAKTVKEKVSIGDCVALEWGFSELLNRRFATKTADNRACVAILLRTAELLAGQLSTVMDNTGEVARYVLECARLG